MSVRNSEVTREVCIFHPAGEWKGQRRNAHGPIFWSVHHRSQYDDSILFSRFLSVASLSNFVRVLDHGICASQLVELETRAGRKKIQRRCIVNMFREYMRRARFWLKLYRESLDRYYFREAMLNRSLAHKELSPCSASRRRKVQVDGQRLLVAQDVPIRTLARGEFSNSEKRVGRVPVSSQSVLF